MLQNKTRFERGLPPYESPCADWDQPIDRIPPELLKSVPASTRRERRARSADRRVTAKKAQRRATLASLKRRQEEQNMLGLARVYLNTDGAHERSPQVARNATRRVHDIAEAISERDGVPFTTSIKTVEGELLNLAQSAGII